MAAVRAWLTTELALPLAEIEVSGHSRTLAQATYPSREMRIAAIRSEGKRIGQLHGDPLGARLLDPRHCSLAPDRLIVVRPHATLSPRGPVSVAPHAASTLSIPMKLRLVLLLKRERRRSPGG